MRERVQGEQERDFQPNQHCSGASKLTKSGNNEQTKSHSLQTLYLVISSILMEICQTSIVITMAKTTNWLSTVPTTLVYSTTACDQVLETLLKSHNTQCYLHRRAQ